MMDLQGCGILPRRPAQEKPKEDDMPADLPFAARHPWRLLQAGPLALDGGAMFGIVPRPIWSRAIQPDARHRIHVAHNCLVLDAPGGGRILVEAGSGGKFDAKLRDIYGLTDRTVLDAVAEVASPADVRHAIVTHLHFDHAGGLTRLARAGEPPHWTAPTTGQGVVRSFGDAEIVVQAREWHDAVANSSVMTRTYLRENLEPIAPRLRLVESPPPFPPGLVPGRDALPATPLESRLTEVLPGICVFLVPGHTWGQQAVLFTDDRGRTVVFVPDVMPTVHHVAAASSLAYDVEPYTTMLSKRWLLAEAAARDWLLVLDHEPDTPCVRVRPDGRGWFTLVPEA
jgi:glyoxylase-like metal-dependent hydrolase (beta-lactamase superfamily II)